MTVTIARGAGGRTMRRLITDVFAARFDPSPHAEIGLASVSLTGSSPTVDYGPATSSS
jgi:hydrogenase maturation factor